MARQPPPRLPDRGEAAELVDQGIRGVTSNPTIFAKAIEGEDDYDDQFAKLLKTHGVEECYWELVITDIIDALGVLRPVHDASDGVDGYVSLEVAPALAHDTDGTVGRGPQPCTSASTCPTCSSRSRPRPRGARHPDHDRREPAASTSP